MELAEILSWHLNHYPLLQAEDIYKLIFQGVWGPGHIISDLEQARQRLFQEIKAASLSEPAPEAIEPVDPAGLLIRVNLALLQGSLKRGELLFQALVRTTREFIPQPANFPLHLDLARKWTARHLPEQAERLTQINDPLPRHSAIYLKTYRPAYRVILARLWSHA